jgi:hypothetical protein
MIVLICGAFDIYRKGIKTGEKEFVVSHGIDSETMKTVILPSEHPARLGGRWDQQLMEWVLDD